MQKGCNWLIFAAMSAETKFADVIIPLALPKLYTYRVPRELTDHVREGMRVVVQFGRSKLYTGLVRSIHHTAPSEYQAKYIDSILDHHPIVTPQQFQLWEWISSYYLCHIGEVMNAALPGGFRLTSETKVVLNPEFDGQYDHLTDAEFLVTEALEVRHVLSLEEVSQILERKTVYPLIKSLFEKRVLLVEEELKQRYKPKVNSYVRLTEPMLDEAKLREVFDRLGKPQTQKQLEMLMSYIQLSKQYSGRVQLVKKTVLEKSVNASASVLKSLAKKEVLEIYERKEGRIQDVDADRKKETVLSEAQQTAYDQVNEKFEEKAVVYLHGVTSSGKTEIYVKLIQEAIDQGKQVLYLLPEIALTTQIITRLQKYFGKKVGIYHSRFNQNERVEIWNNLLLEGEKQYQVVLGARSAVFLPFSNLGLVIVDEEHETSFKQFEPAPRYHARDSAIVLASLHKAKALLGSATPAIESYENARSGKYGLVELNKRFGGIQLPEIFVADVKEATRKKEMKSLFTPDLVKGIEEALENKEQVILFQNRRGFSPYVMCETCGWAPECKRCDVSLTYHKYFQKLQCHYCGYGIAMPKTCPACGSTDLKLKGYGTEKIEEELALVFPEAKVSRMDLDTTRAKNAYQRIISEFEDGDIDILVGTQMVTKGLDFDNVALVGVLNADGMLNFPDFRAFERSYQLMAQVSGRAGRKKKRGKVIIQTHNPHHAVIRQVIDNDYIGLFQNQSLDRRNFQYPPYFRLIRITLKHKDPRNVEAAAAHFGRELRIKFGNRVLGPQDPLVKRVRNYYLKQLLIKVEKESSISKVREALKANIIDFQTHTEHKSTRLVVDVDPF